MSNGYTYKVKEGEVTELRDFALSCARAIGPCVMLRDCPPDTEIPEFRVDDYHAKQQATYQQELDDLRAASDNMIEGIVQAKYERRVQENQQRATSNEEVLARYDAMLAKVCAWTPPTHDHEPLKEFMIEQLEQSKQFDCCATSVHAPAVVKETVEAYRLHREEFYANQIMYHAQKHEREVTVTKWRNDYVRALRESLPAHEEVKP